MKSIAGARCGATAGGASRRLVRAGRLSEGAPRPVRAGADYAESGKKSPSGRAATLPSARPGPLGAGIRARGFRSFRVRHRAANFRRRLVLPQTFVDDLAQKVVLRP